MQLTSIIYELISVQVHLHGEPEVLQYGMEARIAVGPYNYRLVIIETLNVFCSEQYFTNWGAR